MSGVVATAHVLTGRGQIRASDVLVNDLVFTKYPDTEAWGWAPVGSVELKAAPQTWGVLTCKGTLRCAKGHTLLTSKGWVPVEALKVGETLQGMSCDRIMVQDVMPAGPAMVVEIKVGSAGSFLANDLITRCGS